MTKPSFRAWLLKHVDHTCRAGDLALDVARDDCGRRYKDADDLLHHIMDSHGADPAAIETFLLCVQQWLREFPNVPEDLDLPDTKVCEVGA